MLIHLILGRPSVITRAIPITLARLTIHASVTALEPGRSSTHRER
jgi:hypothetical protein